MIDQKFIDFIRQHHVLTLATAAGSQPYCCNCFYSYDEDRNIFIVKTNENTRHTQELQQNPRVALSIVLETEEIGKIQGLQITGSAVFYDGDLLHRKPITINYNMLDGKNGNPSLSDTNTWQTYIGKNENYVYNSDHFTESSSKEISTGVPTKYTRIATKANNYDQTITFHNLDQGTYRLRQKNGYEQPTTVNGEKVYEPRWENVETDKSPGYQ